MNSWNIKCKTEKDELKADEVEMCVKKTSLLESQLADKHQNTLEDHKEESDKMIDKLKTSWQQKCESEKDQLRDALGEEHAADKEALQGELEEKHQGKMEANSQKLNEQCALDKADFKQGLL